MNFQLLASLIVQSTILDLGFSWFSLVEVGVEDEFESKQAFSNLCGAFLLWFGWNSQHCTVKSCYRILTTWWRRKPWKGFSMTRSLGECMFCLTKQHDNKEFSHISIRICMKLSTIRSVASMVLIGISLVLVRALGTRSQAVILRTKVWYSWGAALWKCLSPYLVECKKKLLLLLHYWCFMPRVSNIFCAILCLSSLWIKVITKDPSILILGLYEVRIFQPRQKINFFLISYG